MITDDIKGALDRYINHKIQPGGFLTAVLENDLREALGRADVINRANIYWIVQYCYNEIPSACWGSPAKVQAWLTSAVEKGA